MQRFFVALFIAALLGGLFGYAESEPGEEGKTIALGVGLGICLLFVIDYFHQLKFPFDD